MDRRKPGGWARFAIVFVGAWLATIAFDMWYNDHSLRRTFLERVAYDELRRPPAGAVARAAEIQRTDAGRKCLPGTIVTTIEQRMLPPEIQLWEPPGEPPPPPPGGNAPAPGMVVTTECFSHELLGGHAVVAALLLAAIAFIALAGGWIARGFRREAH